MERLESSVQNLSPESRNSGMPNIKLVVKKSARTSKNVFQRYLKGYLVDNFQSSLKIYYLNFYVVLERVIELNIAYDCA